MPTYKHPCPQCGNFIERDVKRCPFCATIDPFVPGRCPNCRATIEDPRSLACPKCGSALREGVAPMPVPIVPGTPGTGPGAAPAPAAPPDPNVGRPAAPGAIPGWGSPMPATTPAAPVAPAPVAPVVPVVPPAAPPPPPPAPPVVNTAAVACPGCGSALAPGARFCAVCGTLVG